MPVQHKFHSLLQLFEDLGLPAMVSDGDGFIRERNPMFDASVGEAGLPRWEACIKEDERARVLKEWEQGKHSARKFRMDFGEASGRRRLTLDASPLESLEAPAWLLVLRRAAAPAMQGDHTPEMPGDPAAGLKSALKAGAMGLWEWEPDTDKATWSPRLYDFLEMPQGSGVESGARFLSFIHPEDKQLGDALVAQLSDAGETAPVRFRIITAKGKVKWLVSCAHARRDASGKIVSVTGVNLDVTDQEVARDELIAALHAADRRAGILHAVMEHAPVGIAVSLEDEQDIGFVSKAGSDMIGTHREGSKEWDAWGVYHLDGQTPARKEEMALHRAAAGVVVREEEWLLRAADGRLVPVRCHAGPIMTPQGTRLGGIVAWYDVTPFKEAEAQRLRLMEAEMAGRREAERANEAKDQFLAVLSHELRTPLSIITNWTQVMLSGKVSQDVMQRGLMAISRGAQAQARLVDDLLDVSRIIAGKLDLRIEPLDFSDVAELATETVRNLAEAKRITIASTIAKPLMVMGDPVRLQQVVWNLLTNAVKFSPPGSTIQVSMEAINAAALLRVSDQGQGISPDLLPEVFERFRQGAATTDAPRQGLGLGLAIVKHIVERHEGSVEARSEGLGKGSEFTIRIPLI